MRRLEELLLPRFAGKSTVLIVHRMKVVARILRGSPPSGSGNAAE